MPDLFPYKLKLWDNPALALQAIFGRPEGDAPEARPEHLQGPHNPREFAERLKRPITGVTPAAERLLQHASWPGNVRELRNVIERACILGDGKILSEREFVSAMSAPRPIAETAEVPAEHNAARADQHLLSTAQRQQIERVLQQVGGNKVKAAKLLGMSRRSLYRWLDRLDLDH